jgi:hypothetical protein
MEIRFKDSDIKVKCLKVEKGFKSVKGLVIRVERVFRKIIIRDKVKKKVEVEGR